jgi:paired mesoderm homeobox protein 2
MDYSYLNQAGFDASSCSLTAAAAAGMDPTGLGNMPCSYGDLTSCSQMSQAAYRYTAAAASMARSYNPGAGVTGGAPAAGHMGHHHPGAPGSQCAVMGSRPHHQDHVHHRAPMFPSTMNLQSEYSQRTILVRTMDSSLRQVANTNRLPLTENCHVVWVPATTAWRLEGNCEYIE